MEETRFFKELNAAKTIREAICILGFFFFFNLVYAQTLTVTRVDDFIDPPHGMNIGTWYYGDTMEVEGTYTAETATAVKLKLLTFPYGVWTNPIDVYEVVIDNEAPFSGIIDHSLTIPDGYTLKVEDGPDANTQLLQVVVSFSDGSSSFSNYYLSIAANTNKPFIDFDAEYGTDHSGSVLVSKMNQAVTAVDESGTILFNSAEYDFTGNDWILEKPITISGVVPAEIDPNIIGAQNINTVFKNLIRMNVRSSDVTINNLEISADPNATYFVRFSHPSYNTDANDFYENILVDNVIFRGGTTQTFGGNGVGITFRYTSFLNFSHTGFAINRKGRVNYTPCRLMYKCHFVPDPEQIHFYNNRGVSFDAGNDEYSVVWDQNWTHIDNCLLDGTGLGISSKCQKVKVINCHFLGYSKYNDMIHMEEFGHDFVIDNNIFEHVQPARGIYIDRNTTPCRNIQITNNTFLGEYFWIIWSLSPSDLIFENNDFTGAWAENQNNITIDMTNFQGEEYETLPYALPSTGLTFRNNPGLNDPGHGIFACTVIQGDASNVIEYPANKLQRNVVDEIPKPIVDLSKKYRIRNQQSGEIIKANPLETEVELTTQAITDRTDVWQMDFKYPYFYTIKNVGTDNYMEVYKGYTLSDYSQPDPEQIFVEQKYNYEGQTDVPFFYLRPHLQNQKIYYEIMPGGNERKSRTVKINNKVELELAKDGSVPLPPSDNSTWELVEWIPPMHLDFNAPFVEKNGTVCFEAEHYNAIEARADSPNTWAEDTTTGGAVGSYMWTAGSQFTPATPPYIYGTRMLYDINFTTLGSFTVYVRRWCDSNSSNSAWAGLDNVNTGINDDTADYDQWVWKSLGTVTVNSPDIQTLDIVRCEQGYKIDRIVLTQGAAPSGIGPAESLRDLCMTHTEFAIFANQWQQTECNSSNLYCWGADMDQNHAVDIDDLFRFIEYWLNEI